MFIRIGMMPGRLEDYAFRTEVTVREALAEAGIDTEDMTEKEVKLDGEKVNLDDIIPENANALIVSKRIKGAAF